jgi:multidrug efflux pump subunit AcrA (membrane-fusion protein)
MSTKPIRPRPAADGATRNRRLADGEAGKGRADHSLQQGTRTLLVEIDVPNPDGALTPGIYCTVELQIPRKTPSLLIPANAIIFNEEELQVGVVENGIVHIRKIPVARNRRLGHGARSRSLAWGGPRSAVLGRRIRWRTPGWICGV